MTLPLPNLDDRRFADLVAEGRALIPRYAPEWTNQNAADPGITLIELFAHLAEILLYRLNRVTPDSLEAFLRLLNGPDWRPSRPGPDGLAEEMRAAFLALHRNERAVTCEDFEVLALEADARVARAHCVPRRNLRMDFDLERPGNVSVIVLPRGDVAGPRLDDVIQAVRAYLEERRLVGTQVHVVPPQYLAFDVRVAVVARRDEDETEMPARVVEAVRDFLDPYHGGPDGRGWPFGRAVFVAELYQVLERVRGVDYVTSVTLRADDETRLLRGARGELIGVAVKPHELPAVRIAPGDVTVARS